MKHFLPSLLEANFSLFISSIFTIIVYRFSHEVLVMRTSGITKTTQKKISNIPSNKHSWNNDNPRNSKSSHVRNILNAV